MSHLGPDPFPPEGVDLEHPSVARVYGFLLGGTANWAIDRAFGEKVLTAFPVLKSVAIANRLFLHRAVRHLPRLGVRQFIDIGAGIPTMGNTTRSRTRSPPTRRSSTSTTSRSRWRTRATCWKSTATRSGTR